MLLIHDHNIGQFIVLFYVFKPSNVTIVTSLNIPELKGL